mgnify:CR=1 FL=1
MDTEKKKTKNRPFFINGYKKKLKKKIPSHYIKHDTKIIKPIFRFGRFIVEF